MFFLNLWYLWFLPLAAIPVLLNLWKRKRVKEIAFSYFNLLMESNITNLTPLKIMNYLLLILRILFIGSLILFMARPILFSAESITSLPTKDIPVVFVLDNSISMTYTHDRTSLFRKSVQIIENSVKSLDRNTPCALLYMNEMGNIETEESLSNPEALLTKLRSIKPGYYTFNMKDALEKAEQFFASLVKSAKGSPKKLIVLSDNQHINWADCNDLKLDKSIKLYFSMPKDVDYSGVGWVGYRFPDQLTKKDDESFVAGILQNFGKDKIDGLTVRFFIDDSLIDESVISLSPGERKEKKFYYSINDTGVTHKALLSVEAPDFQIDNELNLVLPVYPDPDVALVSDSDDEIYLRSALTPYFKGNINCYTHFSPASVDLSDLKEKDIVIVVENENESQVTGILKNVVAKGANALVFKPGEPNSKGVFSSVISYAEFNHPVLQPYSIMGIKGMLSLQFYSDRNEKYLSELPHRKVLMSSLDGKIFMEEITLGKGRIIVFYTDPNGVTSNFVDTSLFLPLVHRIIDYFVKNRYSAVGELNKLFSEKISLADEQDFSVEWTTPEGEKHIYKSIFMNGSYKTGSFLTTKEGYYTLAAPDGNEYIISYITPFYEGDLKPISNYVLKRKLPNSKVFFSDMLYKSAGKAVTDKFETSKILLIACLIICLLELAVANLSS